MTENFGPHVPHVHIHLGKPFSFLENGSMNEKSADKKLIWAFQSSNLLCELGGEHTFQPPPRNLHLAMETGHAIVATNPHDNLAGFVKMAPWVVQTNSDGHKASMAETKDDFENIHNGFVTPICIEIGSLVVEPTKQKNNLGKALVNHMVIMSEITYPNLPKIAVVTNDNEASLRVFKKLGWKIATRQEAVNLLRIDVLDGWEPESTIFIYQGIQEDIS